MTAKRQQFSGGGVDMERTIIRLPGATLDQVRDFADAEKITLNAALVLAVSTGINSLVDAQHREQGEKE